MSITRHNPWASNGNVQDELRGLFDRFFNTDDADQSNVVTSQWAPRVDIREEVGRFVILADIPGVDPKEIEVHMDKGILSLKGDRPSETKEQNGKFTRVERTHGNFHRRFALPDSADPEGITASGRNGVLTISIPKRPESTPRRIQVGNTLQS